MFFLAPAKAPEFINSSDSKTSREKRDVTVLWKVQSGKNIFNIYFQLASIKTSSLARQRSLVAEIWLRAAVVAIVVKSLLVELVTSSFLCNEM